MEPTAADVAAVSAAMGAPAPAPAPTPTTPEFTPGIQTAPVQPTQPAQQQPAPVTPQAAPTQAPAAGNDPFATLFTPTEPAAPTQPTQPTEVTPTPQQPMTPTEPSQPAPQSQPQQPQQVQTPAPAPQYMSTDQYLEAVYKGVPEAPQMPDPSQVDPNSEEGITKFFTDLMTTAEQRFEAKFARQNAIQTAEKKAWDETFQKYPSLQSNKPLRDMVHAVRMGEFNKGVALTPTQAADRVLETLRAQYQRGVADNQVVTTYETVQPNGGGGTTVPTTMDADKALLAVQDGGELALAQILDAQFRSQGQ